MPLYEYLCECGFQFDSFKTHRMRHNAICPECSSVNVTKLISSPSASYAPSFTERDLKGTPIWFPKDGKPYYDKALKRRFVSAKQKKDYMDKRGLVMDGSTYPSKPPIEAGDMRSKEYRRKMRWED